MYKFYIYTNIQVFASPSPYPHTLEMISGDPINSPHRKTLLSPCLIKHLASGSVPHTASGGITR